MTVLDDLSSGHRGNLPDDHSNLRLVRGDVRERRDVVRGSERCTHVVHLAAKAFVPDSVTEPEIVRDVNALGTRTVLDVAACSTARVRVVVASSAEVYGDKAGQPLDERTRPSPITAYAEAKLEGERHASAAGASGRVETVVLRLFNSYGPRACQPYVIPEIIRQATRGDTVALGNVAARRDFTFVEDTVLGIATALFEPDAAGETINLGSGTSHRVVDVVKLVGKRIGKPLTVRSDREKFRDYDIPDLVADPGKAREILGWGSQIDIEDGLSRTLDWYSRAGTWPYERATDEALTTGIEASI